MRDKLQPLFAALASGKKDRIQREGRAALEDVLADIHELNKQAKMIHAFVSRFEEATP